MACCYVEDKLWDVMTAEEMDMFRKSVKHSYAASGCKLVLISKDQKAAAGRANVPKEEDV